MWLPARLGCLPQLRLSFQAMNMSFYKSIFCILLILSFLLGVLKSEAAELIEPVAGLSTLPQEDKEAIENFFSYLFLDEGFAYVLFGSKPMSTTAYDNRIQATCEEMRQHPMFALESWWQTWEKVSHAFPLKDFSFFAQRREGWFEIFLVNHSHALDIIEKNLALFREKLGCNFTPKEILESIVSSDSVFKEGLKESQALFGLLLGYGKNNAIGFENYFTKNKKSHSPTKSMELMSMQEEELAVPSFASFSKKETYKLIEKYRKERSVILELYSNGNFFELTLSRLTSNPS